MDRHDDKSIDESERAALEAARWLVTLEEDPDDATARAGFEDWLKASPANAAAWADTSDIYDLMAKTPPAHQEHWASYAANQPQIGSSGEATSTSAHRTSVPLVVPRRSSGRRLVISAAAVALAACLVVFVGPVVLLQIESDFMTATAEVQTIPLPDGTRLHLGPDSAIAVEFDDRKRRIRLLSGEAFFEVAPEADRPFVVATRDVTTTVLGTAFDVRIGEEGAAVAVRHGKVSVAHTDVQPHVSGRLEKGEWMQVGWNGKVRRGNIPPDLVGAWRDGQIVARDRPLAEVIDDLRRYYAGVIVLTDAEFGAQRVSGVYNVSDPMAALAAITGAHGGAVRQISPWIAVISGG